MGAWRVVDGNDAGGAERGSALPVLVLIGAASRAGRAILRTWPGPMAVQVHRGQGAGVMLRDYTDILQGIIPRGAIVVNCVGTPRGPAEVLRRVNYDIPLLWAEAAAEAGANHFVQLSSFSVYGRVERIDGATREQPETAYGWTKLAADQAVLSLARPGFTVTAVRIPMLCGDGPDKLTKLVHAVQKIRVVPRTNPPVIRAMLSYDGLAAAICHLAAQPREGVVHVADPTPFSYELLRDRIAEATGRPLHYVPVPRFVSALTRRLLGPFHARLLASSQLESGIAYGFDMPASASLGSLIDRIIDRQQG